jgi:serine/threonine protein kinase
LKAQEHLDRTPESDKKIEVEMVVDRFAPVASPSSFTVIPSVDIVQDTSKQKEALKAAALHLPWVPLSALPPFTHACGRPGASASVFKIEFQGKVAAAKKFHEHMHDMLRRELKTLQLLAHSNIVRVLAIITDAATLPLGFVMEYVPVSLEEAMHHMQLRQAVLVMSEAALGLAVAHDAQVVHSDIKPANILCSEDYSSVKLADFGLAHAITASLSAVSGARGTLLYMAPELGDGLPLSVRTDVFSFGMMMWQVLHPSVQNPFGVLPNVVIVKLLSGHRPDFTRADAPSALRDLVARCLDHNPSQRPSSMWEVHRELSAILQQLPSPPTPTPPPLDPSQPSPSLPSSPSLFSPPRRTLCLPAPFSSSMSLCPPISPALFALVCAARILASASAASAACC